MTDPTLPPDDEIVSAVLDGEAGADERAWVAASPEAAARLSRFEQVRRAVSAPVAVPAAAREDAVAAALAQLDRPASETGPPVSESASAAGRRARGVRRARTGRVLAAAAAFVLVLVGLGAVLRSTSRSSEVTATSAAVNGAVTSTSVAGDHSAPVDANESEHDAGNLAATTTTGPGAPAPATTSSRPTLNPGGDTSFAAVAPVPLGTIDTPGQLRTLMTGVVDQQLAPTTTAPTAGSGPAGASPFTTCGSHLLAVDPELSQVVATATATYQRRAAIVYAFAVDRANFPAANGSLRIYALDAADCTTLAVLTTDP